MRIRSLLLLLLNLSWRDRLLNLGWLNRLLMLSRHHLWWLLDHLPLFFFLFLLPYSLIGLLLLRKCQDSRSYNVDDAVDFLAE